jgi:hypothetical protein
MYRPIMAVAVRAQTVFGSTRAVEQALRMSNGIAADAGRHSGRITVSSSRRSLAGICPNLLPTFGLAGT